jgi:hypothetical protein
VSTAAADTKRAHENRLNIAPPSADGDAAELVAC